MKRRVFALHSLVYTETEAQCTAVVDRQSNEIKIRCQYLIHKCCLATPTLCKLSEPPLYLRVIDTGWSAIFLHRCMQYQLL